MKSFFLGSRDPDRISLEHVFPVGNLVFSTPFEAEQGKHLRVVIEGDPEYLEHFDNHAEMLIENERDPQGRWVALANYVFDASLELIYEPRRAEPDKNWNLRLLLFVLRADLIRTCDLKLSPVAWITGTRRHVTVISERAPLPTGIGNGKVEIAPCIVLPPKKLT